LKLVTQLLFIQQEEMIIMNLLVVQFMSPPNLVFFSLLLLFLFLKIKNWRIDLFFKKNKEIKESSDEPNTSQSIFF